jgi:hypothetical protein
VGIDKRQKGKCAFDGRRKLLGEGAYKWLKMEGIWESVKERKKVVECIFKSEMEQVK